MPFDYLSLELPESKKTGLHRMKVQQKMVKILFCLTLYPDMELAGAFAGVGNIHMFLKSHYSEEIYDAIRKDIQGRRKIRPEQPLINVLGNLFDLWYEDYNINELYRLRKARPAPNYELYDEITGKSVVEEDGSVEVVEVEKLKVYREDDLTPSEYLTYANVIEGIDVHLEIERNFHNPEVAPGRWWVITFVRFVLDGKMRPFILMARLNEEGKICYIQGAWPLDYLLTAIEKIIPLGYRAKHGDYIYLDIQVEAIQTKARGRLQKYSLIRRVNTATGE